MNFLTKRLHVISVGLAMFSMFFGAGNVVFPLIVGTIAQDKSHFALLGLVLTAVGVPFLGLFAMTLFDGCYRKFFERLGRWPGFFIILIIMGLIGPFGAIPRCITLSYSTLKMFVGDMSLPIFSFFMCCHLCSHYSKKPHHRYSGLRTDATSHRFACCHRFQGHVESSKRCRSIASLPKVPLLHRVFSTAIIRWIFWALFSFAPS